jgi:hypothetical protein
VSHHFPGTSSPTIASLLTPSSIGP